MRRLLYTALVLFLITPVLTQAATYSLVDNKYLPLQRIYDPVDNENNRITEYSFEQLDDFLWNSPRFGRWNDLRKVCASMQIMFGRKSTRCSRLPPRKIFTHEVDTYVVPSTAFVRPRRSLSTGRVTFSIVAPPRRVSRPKASTPRVMRVQQIYPPYIVV